MIQEKLYDIAQKVQDVKGRSYPYLKNLALESGIVRGHRDYVRFIILGRSRVGSNFLRGLLNGHSQVQVYGELFQNKESIGWALPGYRETPRLLSLFHEDPARFLDSKVFHPFPEQVKAVGFKIFYYHAQDEQWSPLWEHLRRQPALKVIHVKRRNILKTYLSRQRALFSDVWVDTNGRRQEIEAIPLTYEGCLEAFTRTQEWENRYDRLFADHDLLELFYEELAQNHEAEMARIQSFLGARPEQPQPQTYKQRHKPLSEAIANYAQLKRQFEGTAWYHFFEE